MTPAEALDLVFRYGVFAPAKLDEAERVLRELVEDVERLRDGIRSAIELLGFADLMRGAAAGDLRRSPGHLRQAIADALGWDLDLVRAWAPDPGDTNTMLRIELWRQK